jgi:transcriptional regulator with XRE-family HTH domain
MKIQIQSLLKQLAVLRQERKMSQRQLALSLGLTQSYISNVEKGKIDIGLSNFVQLARYLGVEVILVPKNLVPTVTAIVSPENAISTNSVKKWAFEDDEDDDDE